MYIDIILIVIVIIALTMYFKHFSAFVFSVAIVDILLRILTFIKNNIGLKELSSFLRKYFPDSIFAIIDRYTKGDINVVLKWLFVIIMIIFLYYIIKTWIKKKKF
ncbi:MAG: hypothetical protein IJI43_00205 [Bacilli bacterium]|nr:hypothetical protein [Bacilli bacterium]